MKKKPGSWNFEKEHKPDHGCRACEHNPMGICELTGREVPMTYMMQNRVAAWCPKEAKK